MNALPELHQEQEIDDLDPLTALGLGEFPGDGGRIQIYRQVKGQARPAFVDSIEADCFSLNELQARCGGGDYVLRLVNAQNKYMKQTRVSVEQPPAKKEEAPQPQQATGIGDLVQLMAAMAAQSDARMEKMLAAMAQMNSGAASKDEAEEKAINRIIQIREAFAPPSQNQMQLGEMMAGVASMLDFAEKLRPAQSAPGASTADVLLGTLQTFGPAIAQAVAKSQAAPVAPPKTLPQTRPVAPQEQTTIQKESDMPAYFSPIERMILNGQKADIISAAEEGANPKEMAEFIAQNAPAVTLEKLIQKQCIEELLKAIPELDKYQNWLVYMQQELKKLLTEEIEENYSAKHETAQKDTFSNIS